MTTTPAREPSGAAPTGAPQARLPQHGPSAFDDRRPPDRDLLDDCVHCGFCLPTCPTYQLWGEEMDSPRGRIYLMSLAEQGEIGLDGPLAEHIDACLGCMACVTACPSGVQYDRLLEAVRPQLERNVRRTRSDALFRNAIFALFPYKRRLRAAAVPGVLYQRIRPGLRGLAGRLRATSFGSSRAQRAGRPDEDGGAVNTAQSNPPAGAQPAPATGSVTTTGPAPGTAEGPAPGMAARLGGALARVAAGTVARIAAVESLLPPVTLRDAFARLPEHTPAVGAPRLRVALLSGCVQDVFFHPVNEATVRVLSAEGCDVVVPRRQQCCGALELHSGREDPALARARRTIDTFEATGADVVVTNVAGCGSSMKEYGHLLADDPAWAERAAAFSERVRDVHEVLAELEPRAPRSPVDARVAYHDACHLGHAQGVREQPRKVLRSIPGATVVDLPEAALCCGSAGIYNMVAPQAADELGARKAAGVRSVEPDLLATANPGCLLQLRKHLGGEVPLLHPVQLLDASLRGVPVT